MFRYIFISFNSKRCDILNRVRAIVEIKNQKKKYNKSSEYYKK